MSVNSRGYVIIGYDLMPAIKNKNPDELDEFLEWMENEVKDTPEDEPYEFIYDGMSGEYCFIGYVLNKDSKYDGMPVKRHWINDLDLIKENVYEEFKHLKVHQYPALYSFTHWY